MNLRGFRSEPWRERSTLLTRLAGEWAETPAAAECPTCAELRRHIDALGRLRFELQVQVNRGEVRARVAEARVAALEDQLRRVEASSR